MNNDLEFSMTFDEYQTRASVTALYEDNFYPIASLMVESAELSDLFIKPRLRGDDKQIDRHDIVSEAPAEDNIMCLRTL